MKISYRANSDYGPQFDDPISCQAFEKVTKFLDEQDSESEWSLFAGTYGGFETSEFSLQEIVENRQLFKQLMDQIDKAEAELRN